jgi:diacylglycerol kinase (ATP)
MRVDVDGIVWEGRAWLVAAGNGPSYGGGMLITPRAELCDRRLDVCVVGDLRRTTLLRRLPRVYAGTHVEVAGVHTFRGAAIRIEEVEASKRPLELWAAGERVGVLPASLDVEPEALRVLVPQAFDVVEVPPLTARSVLFGN